MDERDKQPGGPFDNLMLALGATFRVEVTAPLRVGYWMGLRDLPLAAVQEAVAKAMASSRFMPTPRDLRDLAGVMSADQRAILAWNAVKRAIREVGSYRSVDFDDGVVNAVVRTLGGWSRLCGADSEELDRFVAREFQRLYRELSALQPPQDLTRYLPGIFESGGDLTLSEPPARVACGTGATSPALALADPAPLRGRKQVEDVVAKALEGQAGVYPAPVAMSKRSG